MRAEGRRLQEALASQVRWGTTLAWFAEIAVDVAVVEVDEAEPAVAGREVGVVAVALTGQPADDGARILQVEIKDVLADEILFGKLEKGGLVELDMKEDELVFKYS